MPSKGLWTVGQRSDEVSGLVQEDPLEEVAWHWALGDSATRAAGSAQVKVVF